MRRFLFSLLLLFGLSAVAPVAFAECDSTSGNSQICSDQGVAYAAINALNTLWLSTGTMTCNVTSTGSGTYYTYIETSALSGYGSYGLRYGCSTSTSTYSAGGRLYAVANTCSARSALDLSGGGTLFPTGQTQCTAGCEYVYLPSSSGGVLAQPTGNVCKAPPFDPGKNNQCDATTGPTQVGNPINMFTGTKTEIASDYSDPQGHLSFSRLYSSTPATAGTTLGPRWRHNYQSEIVSNGSAGGQRLNRPSGNSYVFKTSGTPSFDADVAERVASDSATGGWKVSTPDNRTEYFASGRLNKIEYPDGDVLSLAYDTSNKLTRVSDRKGRALSLAYSGALLTSVSLPDGTSISYAYDAKQRLVTTSYANADGSSSQAKQYLYENGQFPLLLTGIMDESNQRFATWTYDLQGRGTSSHHGASSDQVTIAYGTDRSWMTNALGETAEFGYQLQLGRAKLASSDKLCATCGSQSVEARTYDANGYPDKVTEFGGSITDYDYNARGLIVQKIESSNLAATKRVEQTDWHAQLALPTERRVYDAAGAQVGKQNWTYNSRGQVLTSTQTDPGNGGLRSTVTTYCEQAAIGAGTCPLLGLVTSVDGPRTDVDDVTTYQYYAADHPDCAASPATCPWHKGDLWKITDALGHATETLRYDGAGRVLSVKDANGVVTDFEYHPRGWMTASKVRGLDNASEADDRITRIDYWPTGLVSSVTLPDGSFTSYAYDAAHRLTDIVDSDGNRLHYTLDNADNRIKEEVLGEDDSLKRTLSRVYNQLGQLQTQADASANPTDFAYDANGNLTTTTDALGRTTRNDYDPLNRLIRTLQDMGGIAAQTQFQYDALDRLTQVTDPKGLNTTYTYNGLGDQTQLASPDTGITAYTYDSAGNRASQTDARGMSAGYAYDALNRLTGIQYIGAAGQNVTYVYDTVQPECAADETFAIDRLTAMADASGSTQYCYDHFGNLARKVQVTDGRTLTLRYAYTKAGQPSAVTYPDGTTVDYAHDGQGRIAEVGVTVQGAVREVLLGNAGYYPFGPVAGWTYGNGRTLTRTLDLDYRPQAIHDAATDGLNFGYSYDAAGNLTALHTADLAEPPRASFDYDALNRLTAFRDGAAGATIESYGYDATGNRTSFTNSTGTQAYAYPADSHRLSSVNGIARTFDATGSTTAIGTKEFVYNAANRMSQVKQGGVVAMNYAYNAKGEQVWRHQGNDETFFAYNETGQLLGEYDAAGMPIKQYVWMDDLPVGVIVGNQLDYIEPDHLGTPRAVIDPARNVAVWSWDLSSEAFGASPPNADADGDGIPFVLDLRFPGQRYDAASGLNYNYFRDYDTGSGRYVQSDPIGLNGGINTYLYANANPLMFVDPNGLWGVADLPSIPQPVLDFTTGVADAASLGLGPLARQLLDVDGGVDRCSKAYSAGEWASLALGAGRMAYAGIAKVGAAAAADGAAAMAFRNGLKRVMRGPLAGSSYRIKTYEDLMGIYGSDAAIQAAAGRTNRAINAVGADLGIGGAVGAATCGCP